MTKEQAKEKLKIMTTTKFNNDYSIDNVDKEAIEIILSMLEEQDKIINLMASEILVLDIKRANDTHDKARIWETEEGVIQYFENKAKEN